MFQSKENKLCNLLHDAASMLEALGDSPIYSSYHSGPHLAEFLRERIAEIQGKSLSYESKTELWGIFAPTSDWDDVIGDVSLGNKIFELIDKLYGDEIKNKNIEPQL
jgi:hypothetical protein